MTSGPTNLITLLQVKLFEFFCDCLSKIPFTGKNITFSDLRLKTIVNLRR